MDIEKIISKMSLEEKISFCSGKDFWNTKDFPSYGIPSIKFSDGPHGLRFQDEKTDMLGVHKSQPATCFPTGVTAASTWDKELYFAMGRAIAEEAKASGVSVLLGPACNIKRNPLGGRNFEYLSEDPYLSGKMASSYIKGQKSVGVLSCVKHFAANNQEYKRMNGDSMLDERTLREIYLTPFEIAIKDGNVNAVMCSYNKINGTHASDCKELLTNILRNEWKFDGTVITDWGGLNDRIAAFSAGCDLNMPGGSGYMEKMAADAVRAGELDEECVNNSVRRLLKMIEKSNIEVSCEVDFDEHDKIAERIAEEGAVLLKNDDGILPLADNDFVLIGYMAENTRYQGSGSSHINPTKITSIRDVMPSVPFLNAGDGHGNVTDTEISHAANIARERRTAVVAVGLPDGYESEGFERDSMKLPDGYNKLVESVAAANENTVVLLLGGAPMELPWADKVKSILYFGLSGQAVGSAAKRLILGEANPSGKLTESWPYFYSDVISRDTFGKKNTEYREGIYVGYRYYDKANIDVRYPFGHGLSYTDFEYSNLSVSRHVVTVTVKNVGKCFGAEVVQLYVRPYTDGIFRPLRELRGFERVELSVGESKTVSFDLDERAFAVWQDGWVVPKGKYAIEIGSSSRDIRLSAMIDIDGAEVENPTRLAGSWYQTLSGTPTREEWEMLMGNPVPIAKEPRKGEFTMDSTCMEMKDSSLVMRIQYKITERVISKSFGGKRDMSDPAYRMMITSATDGPMRTVILSSGGMVTESLGRGLLHMANGHYIRGIAEMLKKRG